MEHFVLKCRNISFCGLYIEQLNAALDDEIKRKSQLEESRQNADKLGKELKAIEVQVKEMEAIKKQIA